MVVMGILLAEEVGLRYPARTTTPARRPSARRCRAGEGLLGGMTSPAAFHLGYGRDSLAVYNAETALRPPHEIAAPWAGEALCGVSPSPPRLEPTPRHAALMMRGRAANTSRLEIRLGDEGRSPQSGFGAPQ
jgi:hypothetical protein